MAFNWSVLVALVVNMRIYYVNVFTVNCKYCKRCHSKGLAIISYHTSCTRSCVVCPAANSRSMTALDCRMCSCEHVTSAKVERSRANSRESERVKWVEAHIRPVQLQLFCFRTCICERSETKAKQKLAKFTCNSPRAGVWACDRGRDRQRVSDTQREWW